MPPEEPLTIEVVPPSDPDGAPPVVIGAIDVVAGGV
jgi:hypothetical protein